MQGRMFDDVCLDLAKYEGNDIGHLTNVLIDCFEKLIMRQVAFYKISRLVLMVMRIAMATE